MYAEGHVICIAATNRILFLSRVCVHMRFILRIKQNVVPSINVKIYVNTRSTHCDSKMNMPEFIYGIPNVKVTQVKCRTSRPREGAKNMTRRVFLLAEFRVLLVADGFIETKFSSRNKKTVENFHRLQAVC